MLKIIVKHSYLLYCQVHQCHYHPNVLPLFWFPYQNRFPKASVVYYLQKWKVPNKYHCFFDVPYRILEVPERMNLLIYSCFFYHQQPICIRDVEQNYVNIFFKSYRFTLILRSEVFLILLALQMDFDFEHNTCNFYTKDIVFLLVFAIWTAGSMWL